MVMPVNPVDSMGDLIIDEGLQRTPKTDAEKEKAFSEFLVEQVFVRDMFSSSDSIYKPDPDEDTLFSPKSNMLYDEYAKKELARYIAEKNSFFNKNNVAKTNGAVK